MSHGVTFATRHMWVEVLISPENLGDGQVEEGTTVSVLGEGFTR